MPVIGSNFKELNFKRNDFDLSKKLKLGQVKSDIKVTNITQRKTNIPKLTEALIFEFEYVVDYMLEEPSDSKLGTIVIKGDINYIDDEGQLNKILKDWKKNKKVDEETLKPVISAALDISQVEAIYLARKVMLPPPIPMPRVRFAEKEKGYIG
jgi:hypothetical protein